MFVAIYHFNVQSDQEKYFVEAWEGLTKLIYEFEGSLGSLLNKNKDGTYIAYAQWPDKSTWENAGSRLPKQSTFFRKQMQNACTSIETLFELEEELDLLQHTVFNAAQ